MRLVDPTYVYIDTNAIIQSVEASEDALLFLVENAAADLLRLFTSELTLAEVLVGPLRSQNPKLVAQYEGLLTSDDILEVVPVDRHILRRSAELRAELGNKALDSIHLATALACNCKVVVSSDRRLRIPPGSIRLASSEVTDFEDWP